MGGLFFLSNALVMVYNIYKTIKQKKLIIMLKHHDKIERNSVLLLILTVIVISVGGIVEIAPLFRMETTLEKLKACVL